VLEHFGDYDLSWTHKGSKISFYKTLNLLLLAFRLLVSILKGQIYFDDQLYTSNNSAPITPSLMLSFGRFPFESYRNIELLSHWIPACAGMTRKEQSRWIPASKYLGSEHS